MTGMEIIYLVAALGGLSLVVLVLRRASNRNQLAEGSTKSRRLRGRHDDDDDFDEDEDEDDEYVDDEDETSDETSDEEDDEEDDGEDRDDVDDEDHDDEERLRAGLAKTRGGFVAKLGRLFAKKKIGDDVLGELEEVLFTADIGPKTAEKLFSSIKEELSKSQLEDPEAIWSQLRKESATILRVDAPAVDMSREKPFVLLVLGVNGAGKTTTIGKLAGKLTDSGKKVLLAAGDTFRAAAVEQLEEWGKRAGCEVVRGKSKADPSSVIFDAIKRGQEIEADVIIADTAGRLHTKTELMDELEKIGRVIDKAQPGAPHETWLVLDSTNGQNAIQQAQIFKASMEISGIVLTKLDGTAKGGVILGICDELAVPVRYIGIGESIGDLREFDPDAFVTALYGDPADQDAA